MEKNEFKDAAERVWKLTVDVVELARVRERCGVYLGKLAEVIDLASDLVKLGDVLWVMVEEQAKAHKPAVTRESFLRSLTRDVPGQAHDALAEAFLFFCPTVQAAEIRRWMAEERESRSKTSSSTPGSSAGSAESTPTPAA